MEYALGVVAAALLGASFVLQQGAAQRVPAGDFLRLRLVADLLRQPRWLAGIATMICGQLLSAWVIGHIILAVAEPVCGMALGIVAFREKVPASPGMIALQAGGLIALVAGVVTVARTRAGFRPRDAPPRPPPGRRSS